MFLIFLSDMILPNTLIPLSLLEFEVLLGTSCMIVFLCGLPSSELARLAIDSCSPYTFTPFSANLQQIAEKGGGVIYVVRKGYEVVYSLF